MIQFVWFYPGERLKATKIKYQVSQPGGLIPSGIDSGDPLGSKVFIEDHDPWWKRILDPGSNILMKWNHVFLVSFLVALVIDPLYL
nr:PREDICTED: cyclic nucleotide-gated ion channel 17-like [Musa acuminata subsp. malaccensis]